MSVAMQSSLGLEANVGTFEVPDADLQFYPQFLTPAASDHLYHELMTNLDWQQRQIRWYGKRIDVPRLSGWYGDNGECYEYSGDIRVADPMPASLVAVRAHIEQATGVYYNTVLVNLYRHERDSVSWHSDDDKELGSNPTIASLSLGAERMFHMRHKQLPTQKLKIPLSHGSLLIMAGSTQHHWQHQIPKTTRKLGPRINLTFRQVVHF